MSAKPYEGRRYLAPVAVGGLLIASVVAAAIVWSAEREDAERANETLARQAAAIAERTVELSGASLRGGEGVLRRAGPMPERGFRRYARDIVTVTAFPALQWSPRVPARERNAFEDVVHREISEPRPSTQRHPGGDLRPVARRNGSYLPIRLVHPKDSPQRRFIGVDLLAEPVRGAAVREARDTGRPAITTPLLTFVGEEPGINLVDPVYQPGASTRTLSQRRLALRGVLSGAIPADAIRTEIEDQLGGEADVAIYDGPMALIASDGGSEGGEKVTVDVLGRPWTVWVADVEKAALFPPLAVGAIGIILAALVTALFALAGRREQLLASERDVAASEAASERETATTLQQALLPPSLPEIPGVEGTAAYRPGAEGLEVGGDFYDLFESGSAWTAVIGDVSGKGAPAAALTTLVRHTVRAFAEEGPAKAVREVNRALLRENRPETFATLCVATLARRGQVVEVRIAVAGHPPPLIVRAGAVDSIPPTAPLAGVMEEVEVGESTLALAAGETLFLYTDGLIEGRNQQAGVFGEERLRQALAEAAGSSLTEMIDAVLDRAERFAPGFPADDVAILVIRPHR